MKKIRKLDFIESKSFDIYITGYFEPHNIREN